MVWLLPLTPNKPNTPKHKALKKAFLKLVSMALFLILQAKYSPRSNILSRFLAL